MSWEEEIRERLKEETPEASWEDFMQAQDDIAYLLSRLEQMKTAAAEVVEQAQAGQRGTKFWLAIKALQEAQGEETDEP